MSSENGIKINRNQRRWHKYGKIIIGAAIAAAAVIAIAVPSAHAAGKKGDSQAKQETEIASSEQTSQETQEMQEETTASSSVSLKLTGKPEAVEMTSTDFFKNSVFIGDVFVYGLKEYNFINADNLWTSTYMPESKAAKYVADVAEMKPDRLYIMLGFDDIASDENAKATSVAEDITALLGEFKTTLPDTDIYFVSNLPITKAYDESSSNSATQALLDEINKIIQESVNEKGIKYIDISEAFKTEGFLDESYTSDGYHIKEAYYPFVLNGLEGL